MKVFVCYTIRDGTIDYKYLKEFENILKRYFENVFIDMLHNDSKNPQQRIIEELKSSDVVFLLKTKKVFTSKWVLFEIKLANEFNIPIVKVKPQII